MGDYSLKELEYWNKIIESKAKEAGLDFYDQELEIVSYEDMMCYEAYAGMPSHYPHWSYGKSYERVKTLNKYNLSGLPYEMVINSSPCIAYLMKDNSLLLQILTMAHVYGHNDFFKNNRLFKQGTRADYAIEMFKNHANRIREYISDPGIGYMRVEKILNAAHAVKYQTCRTSGAKRLSEEENKAAYLSKKYRHINDNQLINPDPPQEWPPLDYKKIPVESEEDLLYFLSQYSSLSDWEKDIIDIVRAETQYFLPQIETKIMNEGWASYWHYKILNDLGLPQTLHLEFLKRHNQVIRPYETSINPYYLGFKIFEYIDKNYDDGRKKIFTAREIERDQSFIRRYLTQEICTEMNLFEYMKHGNEYYITEVSDDEGWKEIRNILADSVGLGSIPVIEVAEWVQKDNMLILEHKYDGRELELSYANETLKHIVNLWDGKVMLATVLGDKKKVLICDENKKLCITDT